MNVINSRQIQDIKEKGRGFSSLMSRTGVTDGRFSR
jgi:hypothetical protein